MIGDFTNFFDNLDHLYLKQQLCQLLGVCQLPDDYYAVYKSVTKYCKWDLNDLLTLNHLKSHEEPNKKAIKFLIFQFLYFPYLLFDHHLTTTVQ